MVESTRLIVESDRKERDFWADSESDSDLGGNFELSNYDAEMGPKASDTWTCKMCHIKNPPMVSRTHKYRVVIQVVPRVASTIASLVFDQLSVIRNTPTS